MASRLVRRTEAAGTLGISLATLDRMTKDGRIPAPIRVSAKVIGWREEVLQSWILESEQCAANQ